MFKFKSVLLSLLTMWLVAGGSSLASTGDTSRAEVSTSEVRLEGIRIQVEPF